MYSKQPCTLQEGTCHDLLVHLDGVYQLLGCVNKMTEDCFFAQNDYLE